MAASNSTRSWATPALIGLAVLTLAVLVIAPATASTADTLTVTFLDAGEADAILVQAPNGHAMLVDAGRKGTATTVSDALAAEGITQLNYVVGTHEDADHIGGMVSVLSYMTVGEYVNNGVENPDPSQTTLFLRTYLTSRSIAPRVVTAGDTLSLDPANVTVTVVNPQADRGTDDNAASVVLRLVFGTQSFLLTGDAEETAERYMLASGQPLAAQILKVGHHGSKTATTAEFVAAVDPTIAVISVGPNSYGHPDPTVITRLVDSGAKIYRTDTSGTIRITATGTDYIVATGTGTTQPIPVPTSGIIPAPVQTVATVPTDTITYVIPPFSQPVAVVTTATTTEVTPVSITNPIMPGSRFGARRYLVGNVPKSPPTGISVGTGTGSTSTRGRTAIGTGVATGVKPPAGKFVRWSPAARWKAGLK